MSADSDHLSQATARAPHRARAVRRAPRGASPTGALAKLALDQLSVAALVVDPRGRIREANRAAAERFAALVGSDLLVGVPAGEVLGSGFDLGAALAAAGRGVRGTWTVTVAARSAGDPPLEVTVLPVPEEDLALLLVADRSPAPSDDAINRLAELGRASAGMAHEIRNPLTGIGTNAQVLRRRLPPGDPALRFVDFILAEVERLDRLIEGLLRFARPPAPRLASLDLRDSIERALETLAGLIEEAGVAVRLVVEGDPPKAYVDPDQMVQVLLNVVRNAVQAMPDGGELMLRLKTVERLGPVAAGLGRRADDRTAIGPLRGFLAVEVRDTGVGIAAADLPKLFEPFYTTRPAGTGLGLSISQVILHRHGGAMNVESELGSGTTVTILIPVEKRRGPR
jgi:signal transduction histidine kinase